MLLRRYVRSASQQMVWRNNKLRIRDPVVFFTPGAGSGIFFPDPESRIKPIFSVKVLTIFCIFCELINNFLGYKDRTEYFSLPVPKK
jgi:hypothetical protein